MSGNLFRKIKQVLFFIGLILGSVLFILQLSKAIMAIKTTSLSIRNPFFLLIGLALEIIVYLNQMLIWGKIMNSIGTRLHFSSYFSGYWLSYLPRYLPGSFWGYLSRGVWLNNSFNIDISISSMGSMLEVVVMGVSAVLFYKFSKLIDQPFLMIPYFFLLIGIWLIIKIVSYWISRTKNKTIKWLYGTNMLEREFKLVDWMIIFLFAFISWLISGFLSLLITYTITTLPLSVLLNHFMAFCGIYALSWLGGFLTIFVPSGLGVREYLLTAMLIATISIPIEVGAAISVILRLLGFLADFFWILVGLVVETKKKIRVTD